MVLNTRLCSAVMGTPDWLNNKMKCVICTGITGSERRDYLEELIRSITETNRFQVEDPWLRTKKLHHHLDEKTILNISDEEKLAYFRPSYRWLLGPYVAMFGFLEICQGILEGAFHQAYISNATSLLFSPTHYIGYASAFLGMFLYWLLMPRLRELKV